MLEDAQVDTFVLPLHGPRRYDADKLQGEALTIEAVRELLGQPVLVQNTGARLESGTLVRATDEGWLSIYAESDGSKGCSGTSLDGIDWIGRAWLLEPAG